MKKILHLSHTDIKSDSRILKEMTCLASDGYAVSGIGISSDEETKASDYHKNFKIQSITLWSRSLKFLPRTIRHILSLFELVVKMLPIAIKSRPDVVHCHDTLALPLGVMIKLICGAKVIYDAHELESDRNGLTKLQGKLTLFFEKMLWPFIHGLIVVSPSIERWYKDTLGEKKSAVIMNSPVFERSSATANNYLRDYFSIPQDSKIYIYVGILGAGRGIDLVLEVFKHNANGASLVFLGYGDLSASLKEVSKHYPNIHVHDAVVHEQVVPIVKSADVGLCLIQNVSLSDYYSLPNKLFEYCFAGIPVLASDFPDISALVSEYNLGICCDLSEQGIADAIKILETSHSDSFFGKDSVMELDWQAQERKLVAFYSTITQ